MFKYLALLLISLTCLASEPKFKFMDCVRIVKGFYKDCKGDVTSYSPGGPSWEAWYEVHVEDCKGQGFFYNFDEDELEGCKK
jgi:hypothetical protein